MAKEELFKRYFPEYVTEKGTCLSPYWDLFSAGVECATFELNNGCIQTLTKENAELQDKLKNLSSVAEVRLANWQKYEKENAELKALIKSEHEIEARKNNSLISQLTVAKELIEDMYYQIPASHSDYYKDVMDRARQFLKED